MKLNFQKKFELKIHKKYMIDFGIYSLCHQILSNYCF